MFSHQYLRKVAIWKIKSGFFTLVCFWQVDKLSGCSAPTNTWTSSGTHLCHGIWELYFVVVVAALKAEALSGGHKLCSRFLVNVFLPHFFYFSVVFAQLSFTLAMLHKSAMLHPKCEALREILVNETRVCLLVQGPCFAILVFSNSQLKVQVVN